MPHAPISTGSGYQCHRCGRSWDQGEPEPETCAPTGDEYAFDAGQVPSSLTIPDTPEVRAYVQAVQNHVRRLDGHFIPGKRPASSWPTGKSAIPVPRAPTPPHPDTVNPMSVQVAGNHYKDLAIQPTEFCMRNGLDFCVGSILKYITRARAKNGVQDLQKGRHFVQIRESFPLDIARPTHVRITMLEYVTRNNCLPDEAEALYRLEAYYNSIEHPGSDGHVAGATRLIAAIDNLIDNLAAEA